MSYAMPVFIVQTTFKKLERIEKQTKAMLDSWATVSNPTTNKNDDKTHINPFYTNTPTYNPPNTNKRPNDNGESNWLFGIN